MQEIERQWIKYYVFADNTIDYFKTRYLDCAIPDLGIERCLYALNVRFKQGKGTYEVW